jgi:hypothetical protein
MRAKPAEDWFTTILSLAFVGFHPIVCTVYAAKRDLSQGKVDHSISSLVGL